MEKYAWQEDCKIIRDTWDGEELKGESVVIDCEGNEVFRLPSKIRDSDIWKVLNVVNRIYAKGEEMGRFHKALEIKRALDI